MLYLAKKGLLGKAFGDEEEDDKTKYVPMWEQTVYLRQLMYAK